MFNIDIEEDKCSIVSLGEGGSVECRMKQILDAACDPKLDKKGIKSISASLNTIEFPIERNLVWLHRNLGAFDVVGLLVNEYNLSREKMSQELAEKAAAYNKINRAPIDIMTAFCLTG
jgi:hypothetical protein